MENNLNTQSKSKVGLKVFLLILIQIVIAIPLYLLVFLTLNAVTSRGLLASPILQSIIATVLFVASLFIALLIRSNKFLPEDAPKVSQLNAMVNGVFGLLGVLQNPSFAKIILLVTYTLFGYFVPKWFLEHKLKNQTPPAVQS